MLYGGGLFSSLSLIIETILLQSFHTDKRVVSYYGSLSVNAVRCGLSFILTHDISHELCGLYECAFYADFSRSHLEGKR